ncbi:MAG: hypothetical protein P8P32_02960 [Akkermansiaceae bacterium]|nr:hypothetical protein [Akkermansiaceae bacterium]MDG2322154.1 hypothetical protein [Akkermansiaceae bacterium]
MKSVYFPPLAQATNPKPYIYSLLTARNLLLPERSRKPDLAEDMGEKGSYTPLTIRAKDTFYDWCFIDELLKLLVKMSSLRFFSILLLFITPGEVTSTTSALLVRKIFILRKVKV